MERVINSSTIRINILSDVIYTVSCKGVRYVSVTNLELVIFELSGKKLYDLISVDQKANWLSLK